MRRNKHNKLNFLLTLPPLVQSFTWASCMFSLHFCLLIVSSFASKTWICIHSLPVALFLISPVPLFWPTQSFYWYFPLAPGHPCSLHGTLRFPLFLRRLADCCVDVWSVRERSTLAHFFFYVAGTSTVKKKKEIRQTARLQSPQLLSSSEH